MSNKPKTGDKYIIEIEGVYGKQITIPAGVHSMDIPFLPVEPSTLYKIKGFPSVVFTEEDLKKLERYEEKDKQPGNPEVKIGDEVMDINGDRIAITSFSWEGTTRCFVGINADGDTCDGYLSDVEPTGRKVPWITDVLEFLRAGIGG